MISIKRYKFREDPKLKSTITGMTNSSEGLTSRFEQEKNKELSILNKSIEEQKEKTKKKTEQILRDLHGSFKVTTICIMAVPEER